jgi:hypothetical protein
MNMPMDMGTNLIMLLSGLIVGKDKDVPYRLSEQEKTLQALECSDPEGAGIWIAKCDFPFLIETLMLDDAIFIKEFPGVQLTAEDRKQFAYTLELHSETCPRCHLKRAYDLEWQSSVDNAIAENKEVISEAITRANGKG